MKKIFFVLALSSSLFAAPSVYEIDASHSSVGFKVRHMMVSWVKGTFDKFSGTINLDEKNFANSKVQVTIDAASINTGIAARDDHLRADDFFNVKKFPTLTYISTKVEKPGKNWLVHGNLTMHGVTKPVTLEVTEYSEAQKSPQGGVIRGASATAKLNRKDFGLTYNSVLETGGVAVGEEIFITIEIEGSKK